MARASKELLQAAVMGFGIPAVLLLLALMIFTPKQSEASVPSTSQPETGTVQTQPSQVQPSALQIGLVIDGETQQIDLEEYVLGVVLSEMPASFEPEALKAQAVAARTYALKTCLDGKKHAGAVCASHSCCQGYMTPEDYLQRGWKEKYVERVRQAVAETAGQVLTYEGELIRATYFSCSGGVTEAAVAVWGRDYPYLQSVESPGEEETVYYTDLKNFTPEDFQDALGVALSGSPETWFGGITYTAGGGIETMQIGGVTYRGTTLRSLLGLRSTVFQVVVSAQTITFETKGYGHRVGMSQYGADAMAAEGCSYAQILAHYYQGTQLTDYVPNA